MSESTETALPAAAHLPGHFSAVRDLSRETQAAGARTFPYLRSVSKDPRGAVTVRGETPSLSPDPLWSPVRTFPVPAEPAGLPEPSRAGPRAPASPRERAPALPGDRGNLAADLIPPPEGCRGGQGTGQAYRAGTGGCLGGHRPEQLLRESSPGLDGPSHGATPSIPAGLRQERNSRPPPLPPPTPHSPARGRLTPCLLSTAAASASRDLSSQSNLPFLYDPLQPIRAVPLLG